MISFVRSLAPNFPPKRTRRDDTHTPAAALMVAYIILLSVSPPPIYLRVVAVSACVAGVRACLSLGFFPMPVRITWPVRQSGSRSQVYSQVSTATGKIRLLLSERTHTASQRQPTTTTTVVTTRPTTAMMVILALHYFICPPKCPTTTAIHTWRLILGTAANVL